MLARLRGVTRVGRGDPPGVAHPVLPLFLVGLLLTFLFTNIVAAGFAKLGLPRGAVLLIFALSKIGSVLNVPLYRRRTAGGAPQVVRAGHVLYYRPPTVVGQIIAVNVGGAGVFMVGLIAALLS